ncbi:molybdenum cofactor biosynthesis protein MoaE [Azorhizobium oxalatiphilum]|uniref:Molybdopterin synthase catalytic subunit n=1 Tax=Azorhizobium oxalatiphilum TaxID=980631 RepID=A0A917CIE0_9HYPH|nr:molybdenum cofactor biosynthesis protein MoaE [Azorhizobium oxalatiphilum]GGF88425.1 molybdenum cofactor biosynthesis protein MoaE [Azorhizobium oxalatiphilum]
MSDGLPASETFSVRVQAEPFDAAAEAAALTEGRTDIGAIVTFTGLCRADVKDGVPLAALHLEHYPGMAEEEMRRILDEARARWPLQGARVVHRFGRIVPGEVIVLVVTASPHRGAAFSAAEFLMDWLKTNAPFWKKEERPGRTDDGAWVEAKDADDTAAERWGKALG